MKLSRFFLAGSILTATVFSACDRNDEDENTNAQDQTFVMQASMSNRAEVELGTLATAKAVNPSVKAFAQMMVQEHSKAQSELASISSNVNLAFSDSLGVTMTALKQTLSAMSGAAFDKAYIASQVGAHQQTLVNFDAEINAGSNQQVKAYASKYRPHIRMHLDSALAINGRIQ